jgi:hypothetical protein
LKSTSASKFRQSCLLIVNQLSQFTSYFTNASLHRLFLICFEHYDLWEHQIYEYIILFILKYLKYELLKHSFSLNHQLYYLSNSFFRPFGKFRIVDCFALICFLPVWLFHPNVWVIFQTFFVPIFLARLTGSRRWIARLHSYNKTTFG